MNSLKLENNQIALEVSLLGGAIIDLHLKELPLNPLNWQSNDPELPPFKGHFLCFDRWGPPSEGEKKNGFLHHGEASTQRWYLETKPGQGEGLSTCIMKCRLPKGKLDVIRKIELYENETIILVTEEIRNRNKFGRMYNIVQHVTLSPPFLDGSTLFDNNSEKGFEDKEDGSLFQESLVLKWPAAQYDGRQINFRQIQNKQPRISSFVFSKNEEYAWTTACNPGKNLLLGYLWKRVHYPWINFWRSVDEGIPMAFGMEFGTTGLHEPFPVVARRGQIFGESIYDFIDAHEIITKRYFVFLAKIPQDYQGVDGIEVSNNSVLVKEKKKESRDIIINVKKIKENF